MSRVVVVFARYPEPGRVKTRLIGPFGAEAANEVHRRCLDLTLASVAAVEGARRVVAVTPDDADFSEMMTAGAITVPQGAGDLGRRLRRVIEGEFASGHDRVVVVGSDCPLMTPQDVVKAFALLDRHDVVIGPAADGGYYLLGLRRPAPALFDGIEWGSPRVASQTRRRARENGLTVAALGVRRDLDTYDDVAALASEIRDDGGRLGTFKRFLQALLREGDGRG